MSTPKNASGERSVTRTYRAAIRIGEDFITLEETVTLPLGATDADIAQAVELGMRIYTAQREAIDTQIGTIRESAGTPGPITVRDPDAPASDKQRNFIANLQDNIGWSNDELTAFATEQNVDLVTLNKGQASVFIDSLKKIADERSTYSNGASAPRQEAPRRAEQAGAPINERQMAALERLARQHNLDLDGEARSRYGTTAARLTSEQAGEMLKELQRQPQRRTSDSAL